ncbi:hypothetical protein [Gordonia sp. NPDC003585]|uniref:hypothetical protein n=1 Tax=unclassified Gordonia (in: high G+C Gram-positive bacteria) TaxID=2657482 RepID=UPI0033AB4A34
MTDVLDLYLPQRTTKRYLGAAALLEAIEIEQLIVVPGLNALLAQPSRFGLAGETAAALAATLRQHVRTVAQLKTMALEILGETRCSAAHMNKMPSSLPVRGLATIMAHPRRADDPDVRAIVSIGFALVAVHAVTDPTNCTTASPALNLVPPPLHRDRSLLGRVLARALPGLDAESAMLLTLYVTKASSFFAAAERRRGDTEEFSLVRYNPHALRATCQRIGLRTRQLRIAQP